MMLFLKLLFIFVSLCGITVFFHDRFGINPAFLPLFSVCSVTTVVFIGGLLGLLFPTVCTVYALGIALLIWEITRTAKNKYSPKEIITAPGIIAFAVLSVFFILRTRGMSVLHVDNFSHWAVIIKELCMTDAFPVEGSAVSFLNYTPGSACLLYFVCRVIGFTEGTALMAQGILISAALSTLFVKVKLRDIVPCLSIFAVCVTALVLPQLLSASLSIYNLLVDSLISYIAAAGGVIVYAYRHDLKKCAITLLPVITVLSLTKSSAKLFSALICLMFVFYLVKYFIKDKNFKKAKNYLLLIGLASLIIAIFVLPAAYDGYIVHNFPRNVNKFPSDIGGIVSTFKDRSPEYLKDIYTKILSELRNSESDSALSIKMVLITEIVSLAVLILSCVLRKKPSFIVSVFTTANLVGLFYLAELFVLYGYIFPEEEATILASFYRYLDTGVILVILPLLTASIYQLMLIGKAYDKKAVKVILTIIVATVGIISLFAVKDNLPLLSEPYRDEETFARKTAREEYNVFLSSVESKLPRGSRICIYTTGYDFLLATLPSYAFNTRHYMIFYSYMLGNEELASLRISYPDYFVIHSGEESFRQAMTSRGYTFIGGISDVYALDKEAMTLTAK